VLFLHKLLLSTLFFFSFLCKYKRKKRLSRGGGGASLGGPVARWVENKSSRQNGPCNFGSFTTQKHLEAVKEGVSRGAEWAAGTFFYIYILVIRDGNGYPKPEYPTGFTR
jgi:hypothetical protein